MFSWLRRGSFLSWLQLQTSLHTGGGAGDGGGNGELPLTAGFDVTVIPSRAEAVVVELKLAERPASTAVKSMPPGTFTVAVMTTLPAVIVKSTADTPTPAAAAIFVRMFS